VRATTAADLADQGPWASIWWDANGGVGPLRRR